MNTAPQAKPPDRRIAHLIKPLEGETTRGIGVSMTGVLGISNEPTDAHLPMTTLSLKPTHKPIRAYYEALETYRTLGVVHETAVKTAFQDLLTACGRQLQWTLSSPTKKSKVCKAILRA